MSSFREIVTKAIIGKSKKRITTNYDVVTENTPDTVLGCWVINHTFSGKNNNGKAKISGSFDVNVWYSHDNDTKTAVSTKKFNYNDDIMVNLKNNAMIDEKSEIIVECLKQPSVTDVKIDKGVILLTIEKEMGVEIVGNTTVKIAVEDDYDDYEEVFDSEKEEELNINIDKINDNYLDSSVNEK